MNENQKGVLESKELMDKVFIVFPIVLFALPIIFWQELRYFFLFLLVFYVASHEDSIQETFFNGVEQ